jgi:hypothetical protein
MVQTRTGNPSSVHHAGGAPASISLRTFAPVLVAIGPAAIGILRFVLPYNTTDSSRTMADKVIAHPTQESAVIWLSLVAILAMVPAVFWVGRFARNSAPRLGTAALALMIPGYLALGGLLSSDVLLWTGAKVGTSPASLARMYDHLHPAVSVAEAVFVVGHVLGTILLGLALLRTPSVARSIAIIVVLCQPLHFVAAVVVSNHPLDLVAWGLNAVAFAAIAVAARRPATTS